MKQVEGRCQVGALVDKALWTRLRALSIMQGRTTGEVLDDALKLYLSQEDKRSSVTRNR